MKHVSFWRSYSALSYTDTNFGGGIIKCIKKTTIKERGLIVEIGGLFVNKESFCLCDA